MWTVKTTFLPNQQIHRLSTLIMQTLHHQLCAVIGLPFSKVKKVLHLTACGCFQHYSRPDRVNCRRQFQTIMVWNESYRECFWLSSIRMSDFLVFLWNKSMEGRLCDGQRRVNMTILMSCFISLEFFCNKRFLFDLINMTCLIQTPC